MAMYTCRQCGNAFRSYNPSPMYCSRRCKGDAQAPPLDLNRLRLLYAEGHTQDEVAATLGVSQKTIWKAMRRHGIASRPAVKRDQVGDRNSYWKGDKAGYHAFHKRLDARFGRTQRCTRCGTEDPARTYEWCNLTGRYHLLTDFERMCRSCHRRYDAARRKEAMPNDAETTHSP